VSPHALSTDRSGQLCGAVLMRCRGACAACRSSLCGAQSIQRAMSAQALLHAVAAKQSQQPAVLYRRVAAHTCEGI